MTTLSRRHLTGLRVVCRAEPAVAADAGRLLRRRDFGAYDDLEPADHDRDLSAGLLRGGFWDAPNYCDTTAPETRIASYIAIAAGRCRPSITTRPGGRSP